MSAFIVGVDHIDALLTAGLWQPWQRLAGELRWEVKPGTDQGPELDSTFGYAFRRLTKGSADYVGAMLLAENQASVNDRYTTDDIEPIYTYRPLRGYPDPVTVIKAIDCYEYQACEHDEWRESEAYAFCLALRKRVLGNLPGYDEADSWEVTDRDVFLHAERRSAHI